MHLCFALASPKFREQKNNLAMKPQTSIFFRAIWECNGLSFKSRHFFGVCLGNFTLFSFIHLRYFDRIKSALMWQKI